MRTSRVRQSYDSWLKGLPPSFTQDEIYPIFRQTALHTRMLHVLTDFSTCDSRLGNVIDIKILSRPGVGSTGKALGKIVNSNFTFPL